ncbi:myosin heavy chain, cardiac muscle isoform isoform X2 [Leptopilina boulardi]|nr:myosin heavy chain, cardiac muscle isoform isoform X2 [Leptopilina boulardi]
MTVDMQQERMELTRTVSHLAAATQQLASAQNVTLMHLEAIYDELKREREVKRNTDFTQTKGVNYKSFSIETATNERLISNNHNNQQQQQQQQQQKIQRNLDNDLRDHLDNAVAAQHSTFDSNDDELHENVYDYDDRELTSKTNQELYHANDYYKSREFKKISRHNRNPGKKTISSKMAWKFKKNDYIAKDSSCESINNIAVNETEINDDVGKLGTRKRPAKKNERCQKVDVGISNFGNENFSESQDIDPARSQIVNARLKMDLESQQRMIEKLKDDNEITRNEYKRTEESLVERTDELSNLSGKLDFSKREIVRLLKELETFQYEKAANESRISNLEKDLQEKDRIRKEEFDANNVLRTKLQEEASDKNKYLIALEDAKKEIQKLKQIIQADKEPSNPGTSRMEDSTINAAVVGEEFKKELILKREARQRAIAAVSAEMDRLRKELDAEKVAHSETSKILEILKAAQNLPSSSEVENEIKTQICNRCSDISEKDSEMKTKDDAKDEKKENVEAVRLTDLLKISEEVMNNIRFQLEKADDLFYQLDNVPEIHKNRILSLKKLADDMRETLRSRERQVSLLKDRLSQILVQLGDRTFLNCDDEIRMENNRQLGDLHNLRRLYEERSKVLMEWKDSAIRNLTDVKREVRSLKDNNEILEDDLRKTEEKLDVQEAETLNLESQLGLAKADCRDLQNQMSVINNLFTQMLLGASSADMDLDRLTQLLKENHDLISDMTRDSGTEAAALPKLLLDLIEQVEGNSKEKRNTDSESDERKEDDDLQQENIAHNLPKVWRVLLELLRCHAAETSATSVALSSASDTCYKSVDTPTGPQLVISVSKTYIRLKELILEKKHLEKEMNRMKQLNTHLEGKLVEQEKRLSTVSDELTKTWNIVGRMQAQHQQLHTHEKILRYELQQKRKMLQELKQELEYCREKWESARQKNTNTEIEWRSLRREFAARKALAHVDSLNNSAESGFSDGRDDESDEEMEDEENVEKRVRIIGSRRRNRKEESRAVSDTESEQPTDTEISESKTISSCASEQQLPDEEKMEEVPNITNESDTMADEVLETEVELLDPLDRALTNVIRNLIKIDETNYPTHVDERLSELPNNTEPGPSTESSELSKFCKKKNLKRMAKDWTTQCSYEFKDDKCSIKFSPSDDEDRLDSNSPKEEQETNSSAQYDSVFGIGPFPAGCSDASNLESETLFGENGTDNVSSPELHSSSNDLKEIEPTFKLESDIQEHPLVESNTILTTLKSSKQSSVTDEKLQESSEASSSQQLLTTSTNNSNKNFSNSSNRSPDEILAARAARLKRLEEQADWLVKKMNATSRRGSALSSRLEELHETYGSPPGPPPLPDVLPIFKLQTEIDSDSQIKTTESTENATFTVEKNQRKSPPPDNVS